MSTYFTKEQYKLMLLVFLFLAILLIYTFISNRQAEQRAQAVYEAQWHAEYGVAPPPGYTAEDCFTNPAPCL